MKLNAFHFELLTLKLCYFVFHLLVELDTLVLLSRVRYESPSVAIFLELVTFRLYLLLYLDSRLACTRSYPKLIEQRLASVFWYLILV